MKTKQKNVLDNIFRIMSIIPFSIIISMPIITSMGAIVFSGMAYASGDASAGDKLLMTGVIATYGSIICFSTTFEQFYNSIMKK